MLAFSIFLCAVPMALTWDFIASSKVVRFFCTAIFIVSIFACKALAVSTFTCSTSLLAMLVRTSFRFWLNNWFWFWRFCNCAWRRWSFWLVRLNNSSMLWAVMFFISIAVSCIISTLVIMLLLTSQSDSVNCFVNTS